MSAPFSPGHVLARFYRVVLDEAEGVSLELVEEPIDDVAVVDGCLEGAEVRVSSGAVLVEEGPTGELRGRQMEPLELRDGTLCFDPSQGGIRTRENRRARGAFNAFVAEANRFGMVNAYVHAQRAARFANGLLAELGARGLPRLEVVVGAHFGSKLPGYGERDGDYRSGELRPMSGGHYRLSTITTGVPECVPVSPTGEVHLGPCRYRRPFAGWPRYLRNAAHNPAIIYHEFGHHLCRHTADFRLNAERKPGDQRNGKLSTEEGICDYFSAAMLGSGRPYGWYRADGGRRRDPEFDRHASELEDDADAHARGATWAAAWWRCRRQLVQNGLLGSPIDHDRALVAALLRIGRVGAPQTDRRSRRRREARRGSSDAVIDAYLDALRDCGGARIAVEAAAVLESHGLCAQGQLGGAVSC